MVLQDKGDEVRTLYRQEFHVLANHIGIAHAERRMRLAHGNQVLDVVEHLAIGSLLLPIHRIDFVRTIVRVVYPLLVAHHLVTRKDERHALRSEYKCLRQLMQGHTLRLACVRHGRLDTVGQAHVIVATHVAYHLRRLQSPCLLAIVYRVVHDLRMRNATHQSVHDAHFVSRQAIEERPLLVVVERPPEPVAHLVTEYRYARHLVGIRLHGQLIVRHLGSTCSPPLAIDKDAWVYLVQLRTDFVHGLYIVYPHQVEAETIDVVFVHPMKHRLDHVLAHHGPVACGFVSTTRRIGILALLIEPIEVTRHGLFKIAIV